METVTACDMTMTLEAAVRIRDYSQTLILRNKATLDGLQRISDLQMFPHTLTHIDLISRIDWKKLGLCALLPEDIRENPQDIRHSEPLLANRTIPCTLISLRHMASTMRLACEKAWGRRLPLHPRDCWPEGEFERLLGELLITRDMLRGAGIRRGDLVVFYTGWREFAPSDGDLTHPDWYPWHPYLMNPYLDDDSVRFLVGSEACEVDAAGIGCDIGTLDSPLRFVADGPPQADSAASSGGTLPGTEIEASAEEALPAAARTRAVHIRTLAKTKLLVEQLRIPAGLMPYRDRTPEEGLPSKRGRMLLLPHACRVRTDAVLVSALFAEED